jgi:rhomboid protease GluP
MPLSLGRIEPQAGRAESPDSGLEPAADLLRELHASLVRDKRRAFVLASPLLLLVGAALMAATLYPRELGGLAFPAVIGLMAIGRVGYEWLTLRRADPVVLYRHERQSEALRREQQIDHDARVADVRPVATSILTAVIVLVTGVEFLLFGSLPPAVVVARAALVKPAVHAGQWWRLLTATYLHGNLMHIAANASVLFSLGRIVETYSGRWRVPLVYLTGALCGSLASVAASSRTSVGASGGVVALAAYLVVMAGESPAGTPLWIRKRMLSILVPTAVMGAAAFMFVDNAAHLGGALGGVLIGLLVRRRNDRQRAMDAAGTVAMAIVIVGAMFTILHLVQ